MLRVCLFLLAYFSLSFSAFADQSRAWKQVGNWVVAVDTSLQTSCFIITSYETGVVLRFGFNAPGSANPGYLMIGSDDWKSLEAGKDYDITLQLDGNRPWTAPARALTMGTSPALIVGFSEPAFIEEFMRKLTLRINLADRQIANLSLAGSAAAATELASCQMAVDELPKGPQAAAPGDPFASPGKRANANDPFAL